MPHATAHPSDRTSACSSTVCVAFSCLSSGYPCFLSTLLTAFLILGRTFSRD